MNNEEKILQMLETMNEHMGAMETRMDSMETHIGSMETRIGSMETRMDSMENNIGAMSTRMDSMETSLHEEIANVQTSLHEEIVNTRTGILTYIETHVEKKLNLVAEGVQMNTEHLERVEDTLGEMQEDLTAHTLYILRDAKEKGAARKTE